MLSIFQFIGNGKWYIIQVTKAFNWCMTWNLKRTNDNELSVSQVRELAILKNINVDHQNANTGTIKHANSEPGPVRMTVKWSASSSKF